MKKTILLLFLATTLLTACGQQAASPDITPPDVSAPAADSSAPQTAPESADAPKAAASPETPPESADTDHPADAALPADSIGPVSFTPNEKGYSMVYGGDTLHAYFKRKDVIPGGGKMIIKNSADNSVVEEIDLQDTNKCVVGEQDSTFSLLDWDGGTHLIIQLGKMPASGESYYVNLEEGAFTSQDGSLLSKAVTDNSTWCYGVADYGILPSLPSGSAVYVGDVLSAKILVRQPAVLAKIENYDENRVRFNDKVFEKDAELEIKIYQIGEDSFTATFYDADDNPIGSLTLSYTASMPPEPEEEAPRKSVTDL